MKKFCSVLLILFVSTLIIASFTACDKLKITNLKANKHFKSGNKFYSEEKFKKAIAEYEAALQLNPNLKAAFYYLGSSYIMAYKPGDDSEKNKEYGVKATENLQKALELDPENKDIIQALGDINDKMRNFELAEKYYLQVQKFTPNDPASYYNLAGFYNNNAKYDKAIEMYEQRIALDPADPEGYLYLADFFQNKRKWDDAIKNHELRIEKIAASDMEEKEKNELLAEAYYRLGVVCWNKSYQTPPDVMGSVERIQVVDKGFENLNKATELSPNFPDPWAYMGLLYKQKQVAEPLKVAEYEKQYKAMIDKFQELRKRKLATEQFIKDLAKEK
ncbi:MAG: tetratricopeptide repeat protein [Acidobacteria bacterium]|jgi:tetratricopeptide (TPR) repeat protein|nr:tetratricopeptide repeat protein [Acidobacteriota bacterium]